MSRHCERRATSFGSDAPRAIFGRFLKFGALAWGGPAAQIAMIKRECVEQEGWVDEETFTKTLAVYQVLPGPEAHELCVYFGRIRGGKRGALLAGLGFMLPGFLLMLILSVLYVEANLAEHLDEMFYGRFYVKNVMGVGVLSRGWAVAGGARCGSVATREATAC